MRLSEIKSLALVTHTEKNTISDEGMIIYE